MCPVEREEGEKGGESGKAASSIASVAWLLKEEKRRAGQCTFGGKEEKNRGERGKPGV